MNPQSTTTTLQRSLRVRAASANAWRAIGSPATVAGAVVDAAMQSYGRIDVLVPNAGMQFVAPVEDFPDERWNAIHDVLLRSPFLLARHAWGALRAAPEGRVIPVASVHGLVASPYKCAYVSAKHGLLGLVKTLALEGASDEILVNAVCPGFVHTPLVEAQIDEQATAHGLPRERVLDEVILAPHAVKRLIDPREVASFVAYLAGPGGSAFSGAAIPLDLGWTAS